MVLYHFRRQMCLPWPCMCTQIGLGLIKLRLRWQPKRAFGSRISHWPMPLLVRGKINKVKLKAAT